MAEHGQGRILLAAGMAAFLPSPLLAAYAANRSYILSLGEALNVELAPSVAVTILFPGLMEAGALFKERSGVVAGKRNARGAFLSRFLSRHALVERIYRAKTG